MKVHIINLEALVARLRGRIAEYEAVNAGLLKRSRGWPSPVISSQMTRYSGEIDGLRQAIVEIEKEIQREADRIVEAEPVVLTEWPVTLPKGRWMYHLSLTWNAAVEDVEIVGEFRTENGVIWFDDGDGGEFTVSGFSSGEKFVKVEGES